MSQTAVITVTQTTQKATLTEPAVLPEVIGSASRGSGEDGLRARKPVSLAPSQVPIPLNTVPMGSPVIDDEKGWSRLSEEVGKARSSAWTALKENWGRFSPIELDRMGNGTREYYKNLYQLIDGLESADVDDDGNTSTGSQSTSKVTTLIYGSFVMNFCIFLTKAFVAVASGALVIYASALDSFLDLFSGAILSVTAWIMSKPAPYKYPLGKDRMEPLGVIVFAAVMGTCYANIIVEAVQRLASPEEVICDWSVVGLLMGVVLVKAGLYILCTLVQKTLKSKSASLEAQAEDHFNDCGTNSLSAIGAFFASSMFSQRIVGMSSPTAFYWIDSVASAVFSTYVIYSWVQVARENIVQLVGQTAPPELLQRITYLAAVHCSEVIAVDTIRSYSFGQKYIAEVDIVLPPDMPNKQAHDIGESLQIRIEALEEIERCFVHIDWEATHKPEHKGH